MATFDEFARAHREAFGGVDPAATCLEVSRLVSPDLLGRSKSTPLPRYRQAPCCRRLEPDDS